MSSETTSTTTNKKIPIEERLRPDTIIKIVYTTSKKNQDQSLSSLSSTTSSGFFDNSPRPRFVIGYWSIRGLGAPLRMLLNASGCNHWVVYYDVMEDEDNNNKDGWKKESWFHDKQWLKHEYNPFINLPFLIDCEKQIVISQTNAIFTYLGREFNMIGGGGNCTGTNTSLLVAKVEELLCEVMDLRNCMVRFAYVRSNDGSYNSDSNDYDKDKQDAIQLIASTQGIFDKLELHFETTTTDSRSSTNKTCCCHLVDNTYTVPDFHLWEMLDQYYNLIQFYNLPPLWSTSTIPTTNSDDSNDDNDETTTTTAQKNQKKQKTTTSTTDDSSNVQQLQLLRPYLGSFYNNFAKLPENMSYIQSNTTFRDLPFNNAYARFGSTPAPPAAQPPTGGATTDAMITPTVAGGGVSDTASSSCCGGGKYQRGQPIPWKQRGIIEEIREKVVLQ